MSVTTSSVLPYRARASHDGAVLADSLAVIRVNVVDGAPILWFPRADVAAGALDGLDDGVWRVGAGDLTDHIAFDHEKVDLVLVDARDGDDERDITTKRFPNWGDAADLIDVLGVRPVGDLRYRGEARADWRRPVVEGSQMLGQAVVAASRHVPGRRVVTASMVFLRAADARVPYAIELDPISTGRTFAAVGVRATQGDRTCATGTLLLDVTAPDVIGHADPPPDVPGPYESTPYDMSVTGRDLRIVDDAYTGDANVPVGPPELDVWIRFRDVPDDPPIHAALVAQFTGHMSIAAALRPHAGIGQDQAHRSLSTAINAISLSFHADVRADQWLLYHHRSTVAAGGMTHAECRVHDQGGALMASFTVDAMVRGFADPSQDADYRSAL
ncbi:MAG: acyl-CoA thioesterase domain-containing protein [Acidimicrobiales bacterium]